ncbi:winged helix-turn-helix domain-containing protein [Sulfidibacter corallicola]|uniref:Winged helix-turn-helix domain-containing protein n=1 Tax=Sulfidibacter corallicola TaxID=2818388 RepID=A0A8A4TSB8_SULCO|nr:winged helix-turn-helix domain-containing protein [Sulfidibacter corallicola]
MKIKIQEKPLAALKVLVTYAPDLVTREQLRCALWPDDTHIEVNLSLNTAIKKLREALGDAANNPRFVATVPRRGYRFLAPVIHEDAVDSRRRDSQSDQLERSAPSTTVQSSRGDADSLPTDGSARPSPCATSAGRARPADPSMILATGAPPAEASSGPSPAGAIVPEPPVLSETAPSSLSTSKSRSGRWILAPILLLTILAGWRIFSRPVPNRDVPMRPKASQPNHANPSRAHSIEAQPEVVVSLSPMHAVDGAATDRVRHRLAEELLRRLTRLASRHEKIRLQASMPIHDAGSDVPLSEEAPARLGLTHVLSGRIRSEPHQDVVVIRLVELRGNVDVFSRTFTIADGAGPARFQQISGAVILEFLTGLFPSPNLESRAAACAMNQEAWEAFEKGLVHYERHTERGYIQSIEYFHKATELDPGYVIAFACLADAYLSAVAVEGIEAPIAAAEAALNDGFDLAPGFSRLHIVKGTHLLLSGAREAAVQSFHRGLAADPNDLEGYLRYGAYLASRGRSAEAIEQVTIALERQPDSARVQYLVAHVYDLADQREKSLEHADLALALAPNYLPALLRKGFVYLKQGRFDQCIQVHREAAVTSSRSPAVLFKLGRACLLANRDEEAMPIVEELTHLAEQGYISPAYAHRLLAAMTPVDDPSLKRSPFPTVEGANRIVVSEFTLRLLGDLTFLGNFHLRETYGRELMTTSATLFEGEDYFLMIALSSLDDGDPIVWPQVNLTPVELGGRTWYARSSKRQFLPNLAGRFLPIHRILAFLGRPQINEFHTATYYALSENAKVEYQIRFMTTYDMEEERSKSLAMDGTTLEALLKDHFVME